MKTQALLSGVAALALLMSSLPASAVSLNIGGEGGLVSTGDSGSGDAGISVGVGSDDGGLEVDANVDTRLRLLEGDSDGDGVVDIFGDKPVLATGGDNLVTVDTDDNENALVTLFGSPEGGAAIDDLSLEAEVLDPGRDEDVFLRLFGAGVDESTASVDLGGEGNLDIEMFGADTGSKEGQDPTAVEVRLFGSSAGGGDSGPSRGSEEPRMDMSAGDSGAGGDRMRMMSEPMIASSRSTGGEGDPGTDEFTTASTARADGGGGAAAMPPPTGAASVPQTRMAARGGAGTGTDRACFTPTEAQIDFLLGRSSYSPEDAEQWQQAARVNVVPVNICPAAAAQLEAAIAADPEIGYMQSAVAGSEKLSAELDPHSPDQVLAVEEANEEVTVYVY